MRGEPNAPYPVRCRFLGDAHSGADSPVEERVAPSAYRRDLRGIVHWFGCSDLHCTDGQLSLSHKRGEFT